ncbi:MULTISPECIES: hypothetical protein [unclassified Rhizobium]|uniref:hypothetical protein n=1 Tax=unclassified Rhizobium TaxID=2613769 RepID=UPI0016158E0A|nr:MULTISPECIES: hypothetical protein [unclassified Rhizobium]MBB3545326.1 hypothetical protein [Rhizobium sp. BK399]MCS4096069.1 hypothetical protein [Rhizobium sp. BK176]
MTTERNDQLNPRASEKPGTNRILDRKQSYDHPRDILATALCDSEKRAILASWASDLFAVDSSPQLRRPPGVRKPVRYEDILKALKALDDGEAPSMARPEAYYR